MVVHSDRKNPLRMLLADHIVVEDGVDVPRRRDAIPRFDQGGLVLFANDVHAQLDAFIADEHGRTRDELANLVLALAAERAVEGVLRIAAGGLGHRGSVTAPSGAWSGNGVESAKRLLDIGCSGLAQRQPRRRCAMSGPRYSTTRNGQRSIYC